MKTKKKLEDFKPQYACRFHPTDWFHEVGCSDQQWTKQELQDALNNAKQSLAYMTYLAFGVEPL